MKGLLRNLQDCRVGHNWMQVTALTKVNMVRYRKEATEQCPEIYTFRNTCLPSRGRCHARPHIPKRNIPVKALQSNVRCRSRLMSPTLSVSLSTKAYARTSTLNRLPHAIIQGWGDPEAGRIRVSCFAPGLLNNETFRPMRAKNGTVLGGRKRCAP